MIYDAMLHDWIHDRPCLEPFHLVQGEQDKDSEGYLRCAPNQLCHDSRQGLAL